MFWKKKKPANAPLPAAAKPTREQIIAQAKANMSAARAEIGDETLEKIKAAMLKKQASALEQAKRQILAADEDKVRDNIQFMMREDKVKK